MSEYRSNNNFSPDEVNALIPRIEEHFDKFWSFRESAKSIFEELSSENKKRRNQMSIENLSDPIEISRAARRIASFQIRKSQAHFLLDQARKEMDAIMETGCSVKDIEIGLLDFPHILESDEERVFLCWKYGEKKVRFWHEVDKGFSSRKPLLRKVSR